MRRRSNLPQRDVVVGQASLSPNLMLTPALLSSAKRAHWAPGDGSDDMDGRGRSWLSARSWGFAPVTHGSVGSLRGR